MLKLFGIGTILIIAGICMIVLGIIACIPIIVLLLVIWLIVKK